MIRDPSDGSVRETLKRQQQEMRECCPPTPENSTSAKYTSGLPITKAKADYLARLAKSHEWLKEYHAMRDAELTAPASEEPAE